MAAKVWQANGAGGTLAMIWAAAAVLRGERGAHHHHVPGDSRATSRPISCATSASTANNIRDAGVIFFNSAGNDHFLYSPAHRTEPDRPRAAALAAGGLSSQQYRRGDHRRRHRLQERHVYNSSSQRARPTGAMSNPGTTGPTMPGPAWSSRMWRARGRGQFHGHPQRLQRRHLERNLHGLPARGRRGGPHAGKESLPFARGGRFADGDTGRSTSGRPGKDNEFGSGRLDALTVVSATPDPQAPDLAWSECLSRSRRGWRPGSRANPVKLPSSCATGIRWSMLSAVSGTLAVMANPYVTVVRWHGHLSRTFPPPVEPGDNLDRFLQPGC